MSLRHQARQVRAGYGGQAVLEGIMIRGPRHATVVCRRQDGSLERADRRLSGGYTGRVTRLPLLRGIITLWETLHLGAWALIFSQNVAFADEEGAEVSAPVSDRMGWVGGFTLTLSLLVAIGVFFLGPVLATQWLEDHLDPDVLAVVLEGVLRLALLLGYLWLIGRVPDIRRVFEYHGAEHKTIAAWEAGEPLAPERVRPFSRAHPRCGTSFLLVVAVVAIVVFVALGSPPLWWRLTSRVVLVPVIAGMAYEAIRLGGAYRHRRVVAWLFAPNLWLQALTTREPNDGQIEVAIAAMTHALALEQGAALPAAPPARAARGG